MFGFGKEKVGFSILLSNYNSSCQTTSNELLKIWNVIEELPSIEKNSDINDFAIKSLCRGLIEHCLDGTDKDTFHQLSKMNDVKNFIEKEGNSNITLKDYHDKSEAISDMMADMAQGKPDLSFLAGVLKIVGIDDNEIEKYVDKLNVSFNMDIIFGAITFHQGFIKNKKFFVDEFDNELVEWFESKI